MSFDEICTLAQAYGCTITSGGKHMHVVHKPSGTLIAIPRHGKSVREVYIKELKVLFDSIGDIKGE